MSLPPDLRDELTNRLGPIGPSRGVGGGCIGSALRVGVAGRPFFLKYLRDAPYGFFGAEVAGLEELGRAGVCVPAVAAYDDSPGNWSWILLEWLESHPATDAARGRLGSGLARMHQCRASAWGWHRDGFIGRLPQSNEPRSTWAEFWSQERLRPQLARSRSLRDADLAHDWGRLFAALPELLAPAEAEGPSLLHGDLWSGNVVYTAGRPALVDPACYWGHREVDLAMAELFGGFGHAFFSKYEATWPLSPGYEVRRQVYQLYYLLVHVNLFGSTYVPQAVATLRSVLKAIGA